MLKLRAPSPFRRHGAASRSALLREVVCALAMACAVVLLLRPYSVGVWNEHRGAQATRHFAANLSLDDLTPTAWGQQGAQVAKLADWGRHLQAHPELNRSDFTAALLRPYGFLRGGALDRVPTPWTTSDGDDTKPTTGTKTKTKTGTKTKTKTGIVMSVGSGNFRLAAHQISGLRNVLRSELPIEVAYAGDEDLRPGERAFLGSLGSGIGFIDLLDVFPHARGDLAGSGWASKPFALLAASHPRTLLVDADAVFLRRPDGVFGDDGEGEGEGDDDDDDEDDDDGVKGIPALRETGTYFYHDRACPPGNEQKQDFIQGQLDSIGRNASRHLADSGSLFWARKSYYEADSGVVIMDKSRVGVFLSLVFAAFLNTRPVRVTEPAKLLHGDKETFFIASELSSSPFSFSPWYAGSIGAAAIATTTTTTQAEDGAEEEEEEEEEKKEIKEQVICGKHMLHMDASGRHPFWFNGGIYEDKDHPEQGFANMTHYWVQEAGAGTTPDWSWASGNRACVKERNRGMTPLSESDRAVLRATMDEARRVDSRLGYA